MPGNESQLLRCPWVDPSKADYVEYHDREWGVPVYDDRMLFEFLTLESVQAGLSWYTVLKKRTRYRDAFDHFEPERVARFDRGKIEDLLRDPGLIRNRLKMEAAVNNARRFLDVQAEHGSFSKYIWQFVGGKPIIHTLRASSDYPASTAESEALSRDLKRRGFRFVGPAICYAYMQATGMVNDHTVTCFRRMEIIGSYGS